MVEVNGLNNFDNADAHCYEMAKELSVPKTASQAAKIDRIVEALVDVDPQSYWLGSSDASAEGTRSSLYSEKVVPYDDWASGEPFKSHYSKDFARIYLGRAYDALDSESHATVCVEVSCNQAGFEFNEDENAYVDECATNSAMVNVSILQVVTTVFAT